MAPVPFLLLLTFTILVTYSHNVRCLAAELDRPIPNLTMQFTPTYPRQIPPTSTVYGAIVTNILKVIDCDYVQVENIDHNYAQEGQYSERTTLPVLTRYHVTCMDPSTIMTRKGQVDVMTSGPEPSDVPLLQGDRASMEKRKIDSTAALDTMLSVAERLSSGIDPSNENITIRDFRYLREINTALFALNIVNSGVPLASMCQWLQEPSIRNNLEDNYINQKQATDIICWASVYGLYLGQSNNELLSELAALEYAVQMHAYHSISLEEACKSLNYAAARMLEIDAEGIKNNVCNGTEEASRTSALPATSTPTNDIASEILTSFTYPFPTASLGTAWSDQGTGTAWTPVSPATLPDSLTSDGSPAAPTTTGYWNTTNPIGSDGCSGQNTCVKRTGSSVILGSDGSIFSSATSAAGTVAPWFNVTTSSPASTSGIVSSGSSGLAKPTDSFVRGPSFYIPPKLARERLRRHG